MTTTTMGIRAGGRLRHLLTPHSHDPAAGFDSALESSHKGVFAVKVSLVALMVTAVLQLLIVLDDRLDGAAGRHHPQLQRRPDLGAAVDRLRPRAARGQPSLHLRLRPRGGPRRPLRGGHDRPERRCWSDGSRCSGCSTPQPISDLWLVGLAGVVGFVGNELVALYRIRVGRQIGSEALVADGLHARTDGLTSLAVVVAAVGVALGFPQADPIIGLVITVAILWILRDAARAVFRRLMDAVDPALVDEIKRVAASVDGVMEVETVRVRWLGHRLSASTDLVVDCRLTVAAGHDIAEAVRHALFHEVRGLDTVIVHLDPCEHGDSDHHAGTRPHDGRLSHHRARDRDAPVRELGSGRIRGSSGGRAQTETGVRPTTVGDASGSGTFQPISSQPRKCGASWPGVQRGQPQ